MSTPLLAVVVSPLQAAAIMLPLLCVLDLFGIRAYLGHWDRAVLRRIVPAGLLGCIAGALTFRFVDESFIRIMLGAVAVGFVAFSYLPPKAAGRPPSAASGWFWAALSGYTSFVTHVGNPPLMVYLLRLRLEKVTFISTALVFFGAMNWAKVAPYVWLGLLDAHNVAVSALLMPLGIGGIYAGIWLQKRIQPLIFYRIVHAALFATGAKLLYDGIRGLS